MQRGAPSCEYHILVLRGRHGNVIKGKYSRTLFLSGMTEKD